MLSFLNQYKGDIKYSQNGEELIVLEILRRLNLSIGHAVEIGGNDGRYCSNIALLLEQGWSGLFVESDYNLYLKSKSNWFNNPCVRHQCSRVDERNVNAFVDERCDLLSLDTDGSDYRIFEGLRARPKIVIIEIDSSYPPQVEAFNKDGAGVYRNTVQLALNKGYFLLVHTGNLVLVRDEYVNLFNEVWGTHPIRDAELYFNNAWVMEGV